MISFGLEPCVAEPLIAQMSSCSGNVWTFWLLGNWVVSWLNSGQNSQDLVLQRVFPCASFFHVLLPTLVTVWEGVVAGRHTPTPTHPPHTHPHTHPPTHPPPPHTHPPTHPPPHTPTPHTPTPPHTHPLWFIVVYVSTQCFHACWHVYLIHISHAHSAWLKTSSNSAA